MSWRNTEELYGCVSKCLHWLISILVILMLLSGFFHHLIADKATKSQVMMLHKSVGLTILVLMVIRLLWALSNIKPKLPGQPKTWEKFAEHSVHGLFYLALIVMPISGWIMSTAAGYPPSFFGLFTVAAPHVGESKMIMHIFGDVHEITAWVIVGLLSLHVLAALKHQLIDKDNVLSRMLPGRRS